jgi:hypothetical protein
VLAEVVPDANSEKLGVIHELKIGPRQAAGHSFYQYLTFYKNRIRLLLSFYKSRPIVDEPLTAQAAKNLIRKILLDSDAVMSNHALKEMKKDQLIVGDVLNVVRGGIVDEPEFENGSWRYRVRTNKIVVVVCFRSETELHVVTCWRLKK